MVRGARAGVLVGGAMALALCGCAAAGAKGGLVSAGVSRDKLDRTYAPRRLALVVGIDRFDDAEWKPLRFSEKDAEDLAGVLRDRQRGAFDEVEVVKGGPTRAALRQALRRLADRNRDERDTVLVYFSSHGTLAYDHRGEMRRWLVARDTRLGDISDTALSMDELKGDFDRLRSRRKVLMLATCHSGAGKSLLPADVESELEGIKGSFFVRPIEEVSQAAMVLAASDWRETAREDEKLKNDIYTHFFVEALRTGYDRNADGAITVSEAHDYARRMTYEYSGGRQRPSAESAEVGADAIVLVGKVQRRGKPELYSYAGRLDGFTLRVDGRPVADLPGGAAIDAGKHRVQLAKGNGPSIVDDSLRLRPGERVELEALLERSRGRWEAGARLGAMGFLDGRSRGELLPPVLAAGATLLRRDAIARRLDLRVDLLGSTGRATYRQAGQSATFDYTAFSAGLSAPYRFPLSEGFSLLAGPRFSAVSLARRFHLDVGGAPQRYFTFTPGLLAGASWEWGRFTAGLELQVDWLLVRVGGQGRSSAVGALVGGLGYRF